MVEGVPSVGGRYRHCDMRTSIVDECAPGQGMYLPLAGLEHGQKNGKWCHGVPGFERWLCRPAFIQFLKGHKSHDYFNLKTKFLLLGPTLRFLGHSCYSPFHNAILPTPNDWWNKLSRHCWSGEVDAGGVIVILRQMYVLSFLCSFLWFELTNFLAILFYPLSAGASYNISISMQSSDGPTNAPRPSRPYTPRYPRRRRW